MNKSKILFFIVFFTFLWMSCEKNEQSTVVIKVNYKNLPFESVIHRGIQSGAFSYQSLPNILSKQNEPKIIGEFNIDARSSEMNYLLKGFCLSLSNSIDDRSLTLKFEDAILPEIKFNKNYVLFLEIDIPKNTPSEKFSYLRLDSNQVVISFKEV